VYDQVGTNDAVQATLADQVELTANVINTSYCMSSTGLSEKGLLTGSSITTTRPFTIVSAALNRTAGAVIATIDNAFDGMIVKFDSATNYGSFNSASFNVTVSGASHAFQTVFNGASSVVIVDSTKSTGDTGSPTAVTHPLGIFEDPSGNGPLTGSICEVGYINSSYDDSGFSNKLNANMHAAYGGW
jgi:hypothetical protein